MFDLDKTACSVFTRSILDLRNYYKKAFVFCRCHHGPIRDIQKYDLSAAVANCIVMMMNALFGERRANGDRAGISTDDFKFFSFLHFDDMLINIP